MALFQMKWLRRLVRRHTNPIPMNRAELWKQRLSIMYALFGWNAFALVCYMFYTGRGDWAKHHGLKSETDLKLSPAQHYAKTCNVDKGKILRFKGFSKVDELEFNNIDKDEEEEEEA